MITTHRHIRTLLYLNSAAFSLPFSTDTSSFPVSYLINNLGFSPQSASKLCSTYHFRFKTPQKPDSVLSFFRTHGFSDTQLHNIITKIPSLLSCNPSKRVFPKFQFFLSKGLSTSGIVNLVTKNPEILSPSLANRIIPAYELVYKFLKSNKETIAVLNQNRSLFPDHRVKSRIKMLIENGVTDSNIAILLRHQSRAFSGREEHHDMLKVVQELKGLDFSPSKSTFAIALEAKISVSKTLWNKKVDAFKNWGWSDEDILEAFRSYPYCMLASIDKINSVMSFWVNQLGWDALALAKQPTVIGYSLERRIIPRAAVLQFLLKKGLRKKNASLTSPFIVSEKLFVDKFIKQFVEDSSYLLNLYEEKLKLVSISDKTGIF